MSAKLKRPGKALVGSAHIIEQKKRLESSQALFIRVTPINY